MPSLASEMVERADGLDWQQTKTFKVDFARTEKLCRALLQLMSGDVLIKEDMLVAQKDIADYLAPFNAKEEFKPRWFELELIVK